MWAWTPCTFQWSSLPRTFFLFLVHVADHLHKWSQRSGYACGTFMSQVSSSLCGAYPTLSPSSLVPYAFVPARVRRCHAFHHSGGFSTGWSVAIAQVLNKPLYVFDLDMEHWYRWYPTLQQYQHCEGMTEEHVCLPTLQDKTTIVGTREEVWVVYPTLETLSKRSP